MSTNVHLSVIVCTYNRRDLLAGCLESLGRQTLSPDRFEVVVVDNNSRDDTAAVVEYCRATLPNLRYVFEPEQGLSHAIGKSPRQMGTHLAYVDDDARVPPTYLSCVLDTLERHQPDILGGPSTRSTPRPSPGGSRTRTRFATTPRHPASRRPAASPARTS